MDYILPVLTQPCGGACSPLRPVWEESVIFNEETHHFLKERVLFFELLDFTSSVAVGASDHIRERSGSTPWLKIAWAFLRPSQHLIGQKCRLQLYKYEKKLRCPTDGVEVHVHTWVSFCSPFIHSSVEGAMKLKLAPFCSPYDNLLQLYVCIILIAFLRFLSCGHNTVGNATPVLCMSPWLPSHHWQLQTMPLTTPTSLT